MLSRMVVTGLVALLVVALVGGTAYILLRPDDVAATRNKAGYNWNDTAAAQQRNGFAGGARNRGLAVARPAGSAYGRRIEVAQGRQQSSGARGVEVADPPAKTWITLGGSVVALKDGHLTAETDHGKVTTHIGPEWYWELRGIELGEGDQVVVAGFCEDDTFQAARIEDSSTGAAVTLRDQTGRPLWAGGARAGRREASQS